MVGGDVEWWLDGVNRAVVVSPDVVLCANDVSVTHQWRNQFTSRSFYRLILCRHNVYVYASCMYLFHNCIFLKLNSCLSALSLSVFLLNLLF